MSPLGPAHPPEGFGSLRTEGPLRADAWVRSEAEEWVGEVLRRGRTLRAAAEAAAAGGAGRGRGPVALVPDGGGGHWAVRHYWRGGLLGPLLGDRYLRGVESRPFREARASEAVRALGFATPPVLAAVRYLRGPVERGDLVTRYVEGLRELREELFRIPPAARRNLLAAVGRYVAALGRAGVRHRDLNAGNVLVEGGAEGRFHLLDLDRCRVRRRPDDAGTKRMLARLERSLAKEGTLQGVELAAGERAALRSGAAGVAA